MRTRLHLVLFVALFRIADATAGSVLLISIDGLPPRYVTEARQFGVDIPNLERMVQDGSYAAGVVAVMPTVTYPNHTTMVTGVYPSAHGIISNTTFDPLNENREGWFWYAEDIRVPTLWSAASSAGLRTASVNWPVTAGESHITYLLPEYWRASTPDDQKLLRALSRPEGLLTRLEGKLGHFVDGNTDTLESDRVRTRYAVELLRTERPHFMGVHLVALDGTQHREGPETAVAFDVLEQIDGMVGELVAAARAADPATTVVIVSDHGFIATHSAVNLRVKFVETGLIRLEEPSASGEAGRIRSWDAQVWPGGASAGIVLRESGNVALEQRVRRMLDGLVENPRNGIARVVDARELTESGAFPGASFAVEFAPGYYLGGAYRGPLVTPAGSKGTHGYLPGRPEMYASFFVTGPGVVAGRNLGVVDMRRIAPTIASALGLELPTATETPLPIYR